MSFCALLFAFYIMTITIIGTGYVGLVTAVCLADAGFDVVCVDKNIHKIELLNKGETPFYEPGLKELMIKNKKNMTFTTDWSNVNCQMSIVTFICVGTPPKEDGSADMTAYWSVIDEIVETLPARPPLEGGVSGEVYIINKSTVPVGTARKAQEKLGKGCIVISMPEFLREGKAIHDFKNPDRIVVGCDEQRSIVVRHSRESGNPGEQSFTDSRSESGMTENVFDEILKIFSCPILSMSWESAELTKYAANAFLATKISFINEIARLCEKVGATIDDVADAVGKDPRIGAAFLKAGFGYGGSCFPKDVRALSALAGSHNYEFELLKATIEVNQSQREFVLQKIAEMCPGRVSESAQKEMPPFKGGRAGGVSTEPTIAILGLAFKGDTDDIRESPALWLIQELVKSGVRVQCYDPQAMDTVRRSSPPLQEPVPSLPREGVSPVGGRGGLFLLCNSPESCLQSADMVVIATEWEEFKYLDWKALKERVKKPVIIDAKNLLDKDEIEAAGWRYEGVGRKSKE